ncbi:basic proline-rich protein-like [Caloenas nicobarica]|uniref:basic proline-rich protein-like n=1 Tax=Caloenas nicobarica TaxID=187106 RepID=UPI0032B7BF7C
MSKEQEETCSSGTVEDAPTPSTTGSYQRAAQTRSPDELLSPAGEQETKLPPARPPNQDPPVEPSRGPDTRRSGAPPRRKARRGTGQPGPRRVTHPVHFSPPRPFPSVAVSPGLHTRDSHRRAAAQRPRTVPKLRGRPVRGPPAFAPAPVPAAVPGRGYAGSGHPRGLLGDRPDPQPAPSPPAIPPPGVPCADPPPRRPPEPPHRPARGCRSLPQQVPTPGPGAAPRRPPRNFTGPATAEKVCERPRGNLSAGSGGRRPHVRSGHRRPRAPPASRRHRSRLRRGGKVEGKEKAPTQRPLIPRSRVRPRYRGTKLRGAACLMVAGMGVPDGDPPSLCGAGACLQPGCCAGHLCKDLQVLQDQEQLRDSHSSSRGCPGCPQGAGGSMWNSPDAHCSRSE